MGRDHCQVSGLWTTQHCLQSEDPHLWEKHDELRTLFTLLSKAPGGAGEVPPHTHTHLDIMEQSPAGQGVGLPGEHGCSGGALPATKSRVL